MRLRIFLISFLVSLPIWWGANLFQGNLESFLSAQVTKPFLDKQETTLFEKPLSSQPEILAKSALVARIDPGGQRLVFLKENVDQPLPIASLTKLMAALIIFENPSEYDFSKILTVSKSAADQQNVPGYGNLQKGTQFSIKELFNLMMVYSSNDATYALTEIMGTENFVQKMNERAQSLQLSETHFVNPTGLDPKDLKYDPSLIDYFNHSSCRDLSRLAQYVLENYPQIFEISLQGGEYPVENGLYNLFFSQNLIFLGGKTGYTEEAGGSVLIVVEDEKENKFINIVLGAASQEIRIQEMQKIINWLSN